MELKTKSFHWTAFGRKSICNSSRSSSNRSGDTRSTRYVSRSSCRDWPKTIR